MMNTDVVALAFGKAPAILSRTDCDFTATTVQIYPKRFWQPELPRFVHMDFALAGDSLGMACGTVSRFVPIDRGTGEKEMLPVVRFDFTLEVRPPKHDEIQLHRARGLLYKLKELGLNVKWATMDTFQSADSVQVMRQRGFLTGIQSLDTDDRGYQVAKQAFYDKRVELPTHQKVLTELIRLTRNEKTGKVDHPPAGSKDVSDCVAGVIFGLTYRREMWHVHGVPTTVIPKSLLAMENVDKRSIAKVDEKKVSDAARASLGDMDIVKEAAFA